MGPATVPNAPNFMDTRMKEATMRAVYAFASALLVTGCVASLVQGIPGDGNIVKETREVADFHEVEVQSAIQATVTLGETKSVVLEGDQNLLELITTDVTNGRLVVATKPSTAIRPTKPITVSIVTNKLDNLDLQGAARVIVTNKVETDNFKVSAVGATNVGVKSLIAKKVFVESQGASTVVLEGKASSAEVVVTGASKADLAAFEVANLQANVSGASSSNVKATQSVAGDVTGASELTVTGSPTGKSVKTSGASRVVYVSAPPK